MFIIIGERINSSRQPIARAISSKDEAFIRKEAGQQKAAGAGIIDINCAFNSKDEASDMEWLVDIVQGETGLPLSIDSPNLKAIESGLRRHKGKALINSITLEERRAESILPLVKKYGSDVIVLTMDEKGMPSDAKERIALVERALKITEKHGISGDSLYIDPLVRPISSEPDQALHVIETVRLIKSEYKIKTTCGLSNVSFGLPERGLLNSVFFTMMLNAGLDSAILDPTNKRIRAALRATEALLDRDMFCRGYIKSYRAGELGKNG